MRSSTLRFREVIAVSATLLIVCALFIGAVAVQSGYSPPGEKTEPWISDVAQLREVLYAAKADPLRPTIWIVAGSNALYGITSGIIDKATGYNVRNYALHAGLHPDLLFSQIRGKVRKGDIVVAPLEWETYSRPLGNQFDYSNYLHHFSGSVSPDLRTLYRIYSSVPLSRWVDGLAARLRDFEAPSYFDGPDGAALKAQWDALRGQGAAMAYTFQAVSPDGDINLPVSMARGTWVNRSSFTVPDGVSDDGVATLRGWAEYFEGQGVRFALVPPVILEGNNVALTTPALWGKIETIRAELSGTKTPLLCDPLDFVMSSIYRMDTVYHVNASGAEVHSAKLAECIQKIIAGQRTDAKPIDPIAEASAAAEVLASQRTNYGVGSMPFQVTLRALDMANSEIETYQTAHGAFPDRLPDLPSDLTYWSDGNSYRLLKPTQGDDCTVVAANWPELIPDAETEGGDKTLCHAYGFSFP